MLELYAWRIAGGLKAALRFAQGPRKGGGAGEEGFELGGIVESRVEGVKLEAEGGEGSADGGARLLKQRNPPFRVLVGADAKLRYLLARLLPTPWFHGLLRSAFVAPTTT